MTISGNVPFLGALNGTLTDDAALATDLPQNIANAIGYVNPSTAGLATSGVSTLVGVGEDGVKQLPMPVVYVNAHGAAPDCTGQGIGTDVIPAIAAAVEQALELYGDGASVVLLPGRYRASTSAVIDLQGKKNIVIDLQGTITPDETAMTMLEFKNATGGALNASLYEGGVFNGYSDPSPYGTDQYAAVGDVVSLGGCEAFLIRGWFDCTLHLSAYGYAGRVLRTTKKVDSSHPQTGALKGWIKTMRDADHSKQRVAQSLWADTGDSSTVGNWGKLEHITADYDAWGPVWKNLNDIIIGDIDAAYQFGGPSFNGCVVVEGENWYIGDIDGNSDGYHVSFGLSGVRASEHIRVSKLRFTNAASGLLCDGVLNAKFPDIRTSGSDFTELVTLNNCQNVEAAAYASDGARIFNVAGAFTNNVTIKPYSFGTLTDDQVTIASDVTQFVFIEKPILKDAASGKSLIKIGGAAIIFVLDPEFNSNTGNMLDIASSSNNVYMFGGRFNGSSGFKDGISPYAINGTIGLNSQISGVVRSNNGGNSAGSGGSFDLGIGAPGYQAYSPMARLAGKLKNVAGTEEQGGISMQFRPAGVSGQSLLDGVEVDGTVSTDESVMLLLFWSGSAWVAKRVVRGAADSGGTGYRMLRVTN
jgi:hypothetical protein